MGRASHSWSHRCREGEWVKCELRSDLREMASSTWRSPIRGKPSSKTSTEAKGVEMCKRKDKWVKSNYGLGRENRNAFMNSATSGLLANLELDSDKRVSCPVLWGEGLPVCRIPTHTLRIPTGTTQPLPIPGYLGLWPPALVAENTLQYFKPSILLLSLHMCKLHIIYVKFHPNSGDRMLGLMNFIFIKYLLRFHYIFKI